jgi:hypothetical protein
MTIIVDDREPEEYRRMGDAVARLNCDATVVWEEQIIRVERKTPSDLLHSIDSQRLNNQLAVVTELIIVDERNAWLPKGAFDALYADNTFRNICNGISEHHVVKFADGPADYIHLLRLIETKLKEGRYATYRTHARTDDQYSSPEVGFVQGIPGIGADLAKILVDYYHTPINVLINIPRWKDEIQKIGKKKVDTALRFMLGGGVTRKRTEVEEHDKDWEKEYKETIGRLSDLVPASEAAGVKVNLKRRGRRAKGKTVPDVQEANEPDGL